MEHKRKASTSANGAAGTEADERAAKRQRLSEKYDLAKQETPESTAEHGLFLLDQIRRTADKNGRLVAGYFEKLPPREENAEYYSQTKMPISLEMIENKLNNHEFSNLSELESYFKRMVTNAKEYFHRSTSTFEDAERVRKALSNYMTKTNPAYNSGNYTAVPTPLPADGGDQIRPNNETPTRSRGAAGKTKASLAEPESDDDDDDDEDDADADDDEEAEDDQETGDQEQEPKGSRRTSIIFRKGAGRGTGAGASETPTGTPSTSAPRSAGRKKNDVTIYEGVPYKSLSFQEAQEKIIEEMVRKRDEFEDFMNKPPRALKDYYHHVKNPTSILSIQKAVTGVHGRKDPTHVSEYKSWASFEEAVGLLWENAYFYNTEDSEIYQIAEQLEAFCRKEIKQAKEVVDEPVQPRIKLKVPNEQQPSSTKITIQVSGRGGSTDSPAPPASVPSVESRGSEQPSAPISKKPAAPTSTTPAVSRVRSESAAAAASPSPPLANGVKKEESARPMPAPTPAQSNGATGAAANSSVSSAKFQVISAPQQANGTNGTQQNSRPSWEQKYRAPNKGAADALIRNLRIQTHPLVNTGMNLVFDLPPHEREAQQSVTAHMPANNLRIQIIPTVAPFLREQQRQYKLWVIINRQVLSPQQPVPGQVLPPESAVFDAQLQPGMINTIEAHVIAALPKGERTPNGSDVELEQFTVLTNVVRN